MNRSQRYLALVLVAFLPSLSGCLEHFSLKADVDYDAETVGDEAENASESTDEVEGSPQEKPGE